MAAALAHETATTSGEEHVASPLKYFKSKKYPQRAKKLHQNWLLKSVIPQKAIALAHEPAITSGEEHVVSLPKVSKVKDISTKGQKAAPKQVPKKV